MMPTGAQSRPSLRQLVTLGLAPSAGLGVLRDLGPMAETIAPGSSQALRVVAITSWIAIVAMLVAVGGGLLASFLLLDWAPVLIVLGALVALVALVVRTMTIVRLFRIIMAQPLIAAMLQAAREPASDQSTDGTV